MMASSNGITGRIWSLSSAIRMRSATGSDGPPALPLSLAPGAGESVGPGCGVPSGAGEPAMEDRGVVSISFRRLSSCCLRGAPVMTGCETETVKSEAGLLAEGMFC